MLFPNWTGWKSVKVSLATLSTLAGSLAIGFPGTAFAHDCTVAGIVLGSLTAAMVVASGTSAGPTIITPAKLAQIKRDAVTVPPPVSSSLPQ